MDADVELSKLKALLEVTIDGVIRESEGDTKVDVLGCLMVMSDQLKRLENAMEEGE